jgi:integrase
MEPFRSFPDATSRDEAERLAAAWGRTLTGDGEVRSMILADLVDDYVADRAARGSAENTVRQWESFNRCYVRRFLSGVRADDVTPSDVAAFERRLLAPKAKGGAGVSRNTVTNVHYFLRGAFDQLERLGIVDRNPVAAVRHPALERSEAVSVDEWDYPKLSKALSEAMLADLSDARSMRRAAYATAAWVSLRTGMRCGEVCALRRRDVSARRLSLHVGGTVVERRGEGAVRMPQTKGKRPRNVSVTEGDAAVLRGLLARQDAVLDGLGPDSPVITVDGGFCRPGDVSAAFSALRDSLGLPKRLTFHGLRHTHATWLLASGVDAKTVSERMGHSDVATTLRIYAHVMPGRDAAAARAFADEAERAGGFG